MAQRGGAGDGDGGLRERSAVEAEEALPRSFTTEGACVSESEFGQAKPAEERNLFGRVGMGAGCGP